MIHRPKVAILVTEGTNCHDELGYAFELAGGQPEEIHINQLASGARDLTGDGFSVLGFPGGFSYGDRVGSGFVHGLELQTRTGDQIERFVRAGGHMLGICNGFQVLVRSGLLPNGSLAGGIGPSPDVALTHNINGRFYNNDVDLRVEPGTVSSFVDPTMHGEVTTMQVAHGEGRFMVADPEVYERLRLGGQIMMRYCDSDGVLTDAANFNGSYASIAGITSPDGNVTGLMPHPERSVEELAGRPASGLPFFKALIQRVNAS